MSISSVEQSETLRSVYLQGFLKALMGFRNSITTTGVNIPKLMVNYILEQVEK